MRGVACMRGMACIGVLGLAACTAVNPAYEGSNEGGGVGDSSTSEGPPVESTGEEGTEAGGGSTGVLECELHPDAPLGVRVTSTEMLPTCDPPGTIAWLGPGNNQFMEGNIVRHSKCDVPMCPCTSDSYWDIEIGPDMQFAEGVPLPGCGDVALWSMQTPEGECQWGGVVLFHEGGYLPDYIASRTLDVPPLALGAEPLTLDLLDEAPCPELAECNELSPGRYALGVYGEVVAVEDPPRNIDVPLGTGELYLFDNRMSSVNEGCRLALAWTAQRWPPQ